jgi:hypothetical protein
MSRTNYLGTQILLGALAFGLCTAPAAHAVQASGSIQLIPSQQINILKDQEITVDVSFVNNSTKSPPDAVVPNEATLTGPITVDYTCLDSSCDCSASDPTRFSFVSCSVAGAPAGVVSCTAASPGRAIINLAPAGVDLAASAAPVFLAQLRIKNNLDPLPFTRIRASTDVCALESCLTLGADCANCAAEGCSFARGPDVPDGILSCKHGCENRISFFRGLDKLHFNALVNLPGYDPAAESFSLTLSRGGTIFTVTVPNVPQVGMSRVYELTGPGNSTTPGFSFITITRRTGTGTGGEDCSMGWFKIVVEGWGDMTAAQTKDPEIIVELGLGATNHLNKEIWKSLPPSGTGSDITAVENQFDERSPC